MTEEIRFKITPLPTTHKHPELSKGVRISGALWVVYQRCSGLDVYYFVGIKGVLSYMCITLLIVYERRSGVGV